MRSVGFTLETAQKLETHGVVGKYPFIGDVFYTNIASDAHPFG